MREKLIELSKQLRYCAIISDCTNCKRWDDVCELQCVDFLLLEAAELLESAANGVVISNSETTTDKDTNVPSKWIPVAERLPTREDANETESILAIHKDEGYVSRWIWDIVVRYPTEFTHWMPLPEPPKGE